MQRKWQMCQPSSWLSQMRCRPYQVRPAAVPPLHNDEHPCSTQASIAAWAASNLNSRNAWQRRTASARVSFVAVCISASHCVVHVQGQLYMYTHSLLCCTVYSCRIPAACLGLKPGGRSSLMWIALSCTVSSHSPKPVCLTNAH